jgi:hypothetical protein
MGFTGLEAQLYFKAYKFEQTYSLSSEQQLLQSLSSLATTQSHLCLINTRDSPQYLGTFASIMLSPSLLVIVFSMSTAFAVPSFPAFLSKRLEPCAPTLEGQIFVAEIGFCQQDQMQNMSESCSIRAMG